MRTVRNWEESIGYAAFHCSIVPLLYRLTEDYMVCILDGKFSILEASSIGVNVVLLLKKDRHYVLSCLLRILSLELNHQATQSMFTVI